MGTLVEIGVAGQVVDFEGACVAVFAEFARLEGLFSEWRPESELGRVNASAGVVPVAVSPEVFAILERALEVSALSNGAFDPTFAAMWG